MKQAWNALIHEKQQGIFVNYTIKAGAITISKLSKRH